MRISLFALVLFNLLAVEPRTCATVEPVIREIESAVDHNHCTTRQFQHMSLHHEGVWFVFYSDGKDFRYQTSADDGKSWQRAEQPVDQAPNGSTSFDVLKIGDHVYVSHAFYPHGRYDVNAPYAKDPKRRSEYLHEGRIKKGCIEGRTIRWLADVNPGFTPDYSNLVQDSTGFYWVFSRELGGGIAHRSRKPNDISEWLAKTVCVPVQGRHAMDAAALDGGQLYVVSLLTTDGRLYGNLFDGERWGDKPTLIANDVTTVAGDDRRLAIEFDPTSRRLHLVYVDAANTLRYRCLRSPYRPQDWQRGLSQAGQKLATGMFTCALSVDSSQSPYGMMITYGLEKYAGRDKRERTGELYARRFDGSRWQGEPMLVTQPGTIHNWYPNVNRDAHHGLCVMYSRAVDKTRLQKPLAIMVSVLGNEEGVSHAARNVIFLDNKAGIVNGSSSYDPQTRTCGKGEYAVFTELGEAAKAIQSGGTLYIRAGTYSRPLTGEFHRDTRGTGAKRYQEGALNITADGMAENRTRVAAYSGELVVIQAKPGVSNYNSNPADTEFGQSSFHYGRAAITVFASYVDVVGLTTYGQICVPAHDVLVEGCDLGGGGGRVPQGQVVYLGGYNNIIRNNRIHHSCWGESTKNGAALMGYNFSCIIENNEFYDNYGADIRLKDAGGQQGRTTIVRKNFFRPTSINPRGNHGVEGISQDGQIDRILIHNNIFFRKKIGIQWDGPAMKGTLAHNNTFIDCDMDISQWFKDVRVALSNNLYFHRDRGAQFYHIVQHDEPQLLNLQSAHNLFFSVAGDTSWYNLYRRRASNLGDWQEYSGKDKNSVWKDPQFVNPMGSGPEDFKRKGDPKEIKDVAGSEHGPVCGAYVTGDELIGPPPATVVK